MQRRTFLQALLAIAATRTVRAAGNRPPRILLRSSWQDVNIGDIAHTPGVLALLEEHIPEAEVVVWAGSRLTEEVIAILRRRFPKVRIVKGSINDDGTVTSDELAQAVEETDFLLHGSGPHFVAEDDVAAFVEKTGKPFGVYGITHVHGDAARRKLMSRAEFLFFRDSVSLKVAREEGIEAPIMEFGPDGSFACDVTNDEAALAFLEEKQLEPGRFLCCIPRLRWTPYWRIREREMTARDKRKKARNEQDAEHDHKPLREAIAAVVRETDHKVLVCPEDMSQMLVGKRHIIDKLPDDIRERVAWRENFWLTDEAISVYKRSSGLFGLEMHSPIMCIGNGIPAIVCRFREQTSKGFMWRDIGLEEWLFNIDRPEEVAQLTETVLGLVQNPKETQRRVTGARQMVARRQRETMEVLENCL